MTKKISLSLPNDLFEKLMRLSTESGKTRSTIITSSLRAYIGESKLPQEPKIHPTALWKLKERSFIRMRSPKLTSARVGKDWVIESEV